MDEAGEKLPVTRLTGLVLMLACFAMQAVAADMTQPLPARNLYPPMMRFFDPVPDSALRRYTQAWSFELNQHYATMNSFDTYPNPQLLADMELYVIEPVLRRSLGDTLELSLRAPVLRPLAGVFDAPIQTFHHLFGMPNGGRQYRPNNSFAYTFDNTRGASWQGRDRWELGNVEVSGRYRLGEGRGWALAALAAVKLPTASKARGWGSGAADLGAGVVASWEEGLWFGHVEGWVVQPMANDVPGVRYVTYLRGSVVAGYRYHDLSWIAQGQGGSSPYDGTNLRWLDDPPFLISFGLRGKTQGGIGWSATVTENITQNTTQDISVSVGLSWPI